MHEADRNRSESPVRNISSRSVARRSRFKWLADVALGINSFVGADDRAISGLGQLNIERKDVRAGLVADAQCIFEAGGDDQHRRFATAFEQCIRRDGRAHANGVDSQGRLGLSQGFR